MVMALLKLVSCRVGVYIDRYVLFMVPPCPSVVDEDISTPIEGIL